MFDILKQRTLRFYECKGKRSVNIKIDIFKSILLTVTKKLEIFILELLVLELLLLELSILELLVLEQ